MSKAACALSDRSSSTKGGKVIPEGNPQQIDSFCRTLTCIRDRANVRLADVENSGRADIIWLNKYTGAASVWRNNGSPAGGGGGGSSFSWTKRGVLYSPIDRGEVMVSSPISLRFLTKKKEEEG